MANVSFQAPTDYQIEADDIARRRKYAEALQAQSMQAPETQIVGGWAIPNSPTQGLGRLAQAYAARKGQERASAELKAVGERYNTERGAALAAALRAGQGTPAQTIQPDPQEAQQSADFGTPEVPAVQQAAVPGSRQAMIAALTGSKFPDLQQVGLAETLKTPESQFNKVDPAHYTPASVQKFSVTGRHADLVPRDKIVADNLGGTTNYRTEYSTAPVAPAAPHTAPPKEDELARAIEAAGIDPASPEALALFKSRADKLATHAPPPRVNVTQTQSTEKKYGEKFASEVATADSAMRDAAIKAPQLAERANQVKQILADTKVITGTGADFRLAVTKAAALAGIKGADGLAANSEQLGSLLAQNTLDSIKASGLGSGNGFSNADRDFLQKAVNGEIKFEKETLSRAANLAHRAADLTAQRWSTRVKEIPASALEGTGIKTDPIVVPRLYGTPDAGAAVRSKADAILNGNR